MEAVRILLADSDEEYRQSMAERLGGIDGICVVGGTDRGDCVLHLLRTTGAAVLVTELPLRGMDGLSVIRQVRAELGQSVRIVVCSCLTGGGAITRALELGADVYVCKPVTVERLAEHLR